MPEVDSYTQDVTEQRLVRPSRFAFRDSYGWPVERIIGRPINNVIRLILHTDIVQSCCRPNKALSEQPHRRAEDGQTERAERTESGRSAGRTAPCPVAETGRPVIEDRKEVE